MDWKQGGPTTPLLDTVNFPVHLKNLSPRQLQQLCKELRAGKFFWNYSAYYALYYLFGGAFRPNSHRVQDWGTLGIEPRSGGTYCRSSSRI